MWLNIDALKTNGFAIIEEIHSQDDLISLAKSIGKIVPHPNGKNVAVLTSSNGENSLKGTFSHTYGLAAFPFHTDTAFWTLPARYVVMGMFAASRCTTNYVSMNEIAKWISGDLFSKAQQSLYLLKTIEGAKYTSAAFKKNGMWGIRFDPNIMTPMNEQAKKFHHELMIAIENAGCKKINWTGNKAVVFDNWNYLHARSAVNGESRELYRIYLEG